MGVLRSVWGAMFGSSFRDGELVSGFAAAYVRGGSSGPSLRL